MTAPRDIGEFERSLVCNMCGKTLMLDEDVRYEVRINVYCAADPIEIGPGELERDLRGELARLLRQAEEMDEQELLDSVHREFKFHLCPRCQKAYLKNPLPPPPDGPAPAP